MSNGSDLAFIGFGEAASAFASGIDRTCGHAGSGARRIAAYDIKTDAAATRAAMLARYRDFDVEGETGIADAVRGTAAVFCLVTADRALEAAKSAAGSVGDTGLEGALWLDGNSCAPHSKRLAAEVIEGAGGRYVDVAIMAPVHPLKRRVPLLLSGPHAAEAATVLASYGMVGEIVGPAVGAASSIKMIRSVMIKGMEALSAECLLAARRAGVEEAVIASLSGSNPEIAWCERFAYNLERMMVHGARRAAEMREVAATLADLGLPNGMARETADWQDRIGEAGLEPGPDDALARADRILRRM